MRALFFSVMMMLSSDASAQDGLQRLSRELWTWRVARQPFGRDDIPRVERPPGWHPDWSRRAVERQLEELRRLEARWKALASLSAPIAAQVDHRLVGSALARVRWELEIGRGWRRNPLFYVDQTLGGLVEALLPPEPFGPSRSDEVVARLEDVPAVLEAARANLDEAVRPFARLAIEDLRDVGPRVRAAARELKPRLSPPAATRIDAVTEEAARALDGYREWLEAREASWPEATSVGRDAYLFFLREVALCPFTPEQLLAMGRQEWERSVAFEALEAQRNRGLPALPLFADAPAQIARQERDERAIRRFLEEKDILSVPSWVAPYRYRKVPGYLQALAGFGEWTDFSSESRLSEGSTRYIPEPAPDLGYFARSMAEDPRADMVHEGIPGHAFQMALSWRHENEIRRRYYDSGPNEGIGFYAEEMMLQAGLFEDSPRTREMLYSYMRLRALRVEVDVNLATGAFSIDQAADYLEKAVPVDRQTARAEAAFFASTPGQAITYQIGKLHLVRFLADARRLQGDRFRLRDFHDFVWKNGNVPIALQRFEYLGLRDEIDVLDRVR